MHPLLSCLGLAVAYVAPFYLRPKRSRNVRETVVFRMTCTCVTSSVAWVPLWLELAKSGHATRETLLLLLGLRWRSLPSAVMRPLALTAVLFTGPIATEALNWWDGEPLPHRQPLLTRLGLRNLVVAPATEEFTFRACMAPLLLLHGAGLRKTILVTPIMFGVAHLHHLYELVRFQGASLPGAALMVSFQFLFTGPAFGTYATFVFLRTGHLAAAIAVHSFCNWMGFPPIADVLSHPQSRKLLAFYMLGICGFAALVRPVTNPALYTNIQYDQTVKAVVAQRGMH